MCGAAWVDSLSRGSSRTPPQGCAAQTLRSYPSAEKLILNMTSSEVDPPLQEEDVLIEYSNGIGCARRNFQTSASRLPQPPDLRSSSLPRQTEKVPFYGSQEFHALSYISQPRVISDDHSVYANPVSLVSSVENLHRPLVADDQQQHSRFHSMTNIATPIPENTLAHQQQQGSLSTFQSSCTLKAEEDDEDLSYGYTVALSRVPRQTETGSVADSGCPPSDVASSSSSPPPYVAPPSYSSICHRAGHYGSQPALSMSRESLNSLGNNPASHADPLFRPRAASISGRPPSGYSSLPRARTNMTDSFQQAVNPSYNDVPSTIHGMECYGKIKRYGSSPSE